MQLGQSFSGPKTVDENYLKGRHVLKTVGFAVRTLAGFECMLMTDNGALY